MTESVRAFAEAWEALHELPVPGDAVATARWNNRRRAAVDTVAATAERLPRFAVRLVPRHQEYEHTAFDWERLRVNVYHRVAPGLLRWEGA